MAVSITKRDVSHSLHTSSVVYIDKIKHTSLVSQSRAVEQVRTCKNRPEALSSLSSRDKEPSVTYLDEQDRVSQGNSILDRNIHVTTGQDSLA